jgi:small subunit ribosomal protein S16
LVESKRAAKTGSFNEVLGSYDPRSDRVELKAERIKHWISMGATVSDTLHNLLVSQKIIDAKKINVLPRKSPPAKEEVAVAGTDEGGTAPAAPKAAEVAEPAPADTAESAPEEAPVEEKGDNAVAEEKASA